MTNVYWDHINGTTIKNQDDILNSKIKILNATRNKGDVLIYAGNRRESVSYKAAKIMKKNRPDLNFTQYDEKPAGNPQNETFHLKKSHIYLGRRDIFSLSEHDFDGIRSNFFWKLNILALAAVLHALYIPLENLYNNVAKLMSSVPGRWNHFEKNGYNIILDYAHEKKSLSMASRIVLFMAACFWAVVYGVLNIIAVIVRGTIIC